MLAPLAFAFALFATQAVAQQAHWGQCGGQGWNGATSCQSGLECRYQNDYYSQCLDGNDNPAWAEEGDDNGSDEGSDEGSDDGSDDGSDEGSDGDQ